MAHMFSQWGAKCAANILVTHDQITDYLFGWDTPADAPEYLDFLKQYIAAIAKELEAEDISQFTYFHISDEPSLEAVDAYRRASDIIRPLIGNSKTMDALSSYDFYEKGLVECPVTCVDHMKDFLGHQIPNQWVYYCCQPEKVYTNSFLAMPSRRVRILGFLLYKYDIKGFLHWGFNFYNTSLSYHLCRWRLCFRRRLYRLSRTGLRIPLYPWRDHLSGHPGYAPLPGSGRKDWQGCSGFPD